VFGSVVVLVVVVSFSKEEADDRDDDEFGSVEKNFILLDVSATRNNLDRSLAKIPVPLTFGIFVCVNESMDGIDVEVVWIGEK
jgi:hypothetical protein